MRILKTIKKIDGNIITVELYKKGYYFRARFYNYTKNKNITLKGKEALICTMFDIDPWNKKQIKIQDYLCTWKDLTGWLDDYIANENRINGEQLNLFTT